MRGSSLLLLAVLCCPGTLSAAGLKILSAGVAQLGLSQAIPLYEHSTGDHLTVEFTTPARLKERVLAGEAADVLIAPSAVINPVIAGGRTLDSRLTIGQAGVGVAVRKGDAAPAIATIDEVKQAATGASTVIYNRASSGIYIDQLFEQLGIATQIAGKVRRYDDGDAVLSYIIKAAPGTVGFGAVPEIMRYTDKGVDYVGPLPAEIQNYTRYEAVRLKGSRNAAANFLRFLGSAPAQTLFEQSGLEPAPSAPPLDPVN